MKFPLSSVLVPNYTVLSRKYLGTELQTHKMKRYLVILLSKRINSDCRFSKMLL